MILENHHVFFDAPGGRPTGEIVGELRSWLDDNQITPAGFEYAVTRSGAIEMQLTFGNRHQADLFERAFCLVNRP